MRKYHGEYLVVIQQEVETIFNLSLENIEGITEYIRTGALIPIGEGNKPIRQSLSNIRNMKPNQMRVLADILFNSIRVGYPEIYDDLSECIRADALKQEDWQEYGVRGLKKTVVVVDNNG